MEKEEGINSAQLIRTRLLCARHSDVIVIITFLSVNLCVFCCSLSKSW